MIPTLETPRLLLRGHGLTDFADSREMWASESVTRYTIGKPSSEQQTWIRVLAYSGHWTLLGYGYWAIEEKSSRKLIGDIGFADFRRELKPSIHGIPEMGWALTCAAQGKGYAKEAIEAALKWADLNLAATRTACIIHPENHRSIGLAEKYGFQWALDTEFMGAPIKLYFREQART